MRLIIVALAVLLLDGVALAHPPPGVDLNGAEHLWWESQHNPHLNGMSCCAEADGHVLRSDQWKETGDQDFPFKVLIEGKWWPMPARALVLPQGGPDPNRNAAWQAHVWWGEQRGPNGKLLNVYFYCAEMGGAF